jgi:hypothetical protein
MPVTGHLQATVVSKIQANRIAKLSSHYLRNNGQFVPHASVAGVGFAVS